MRYMGIDFGSKKVGIAISDEMATMGFPHKILPNNSTLLDDICIIIDKHAVGAVVMGESKNFHGEENKIAYSARMFTDKLKKRINIPVFFESEIFTTQEALRLPTGERTTEHYPVDAAAAALILTSYLSHYDHN